MFDDIKAFSNAIKNSPNSHIIHLFAMAIAVLTPFYITALYLFQPSVFNFKYAFIAIFIAIALSVSTFVFAFIASIMTHYQSGKPLEADDVMLHAAIVAIMKLSIVIFLSWLLEKYRDVSFSKFVLFVHVVVGGQVFFKQFVDLFKKK